MKKDKKDHFANLDVNSVLDNKKFWQNVKPLFSNKVNAKTTIKLIENDETIDNEIKFAKIFNEYFVNTLKNLRILTEMESATFTENNLSEVEMALKKNKNYPSITAITKKMKNLGNSTFSFNFISHDDIMKELNKLKTKKASQKTGVPIKLVKENVEIISHFLHHIFKNSLSCSTFPTGMKYGDVTPIHKKDDKTDKTNDHPISILPNRNKIYETLMYNQISPYLDSVFYKFQCGFRKGFNAQHCLLTMVEKWCKSLDKGGETGAVLTDLSKAFYCIDHNSLRAKLNAYGFEKRSLEFIHSYLTKRKQRTKVDSAFSPWEMLLSGVPQGSILGPLLFNIYICDMFFETPENIDFTEYADDKTPKTYSSKTQHLLSNLQGASEKLFSWFSANHLVANAGKCNLLTSSNLPVDIRITNTKISNLDRVKLLGVNFEGRLNFHYHVNTLLKKANKKYHALARVCNYMDTKKQRVLMKAFITYQFSYCPLVWMFHSRTLNN